MDYPVFYPAIPNIVVTDYVRRTLGPIKKWVWTNARNLAFAEWEASGLRFDISAGEGLPPAWPFCDHGQITITAQELDPWGTGRPAVCPFYQAPYACASLQVDYGLLGWFDKYNRSYLRSLLAHEIGHALGFAHVGTGIMRFGYDPDASRHVTTWELEQVRDYFGLEG